MATPTFPQRDPADAGFWDLRYQARFAPWDAGRVPAQLRAFVEAATRPRTVLVPGCGSAWDVRFLADSGWQVVGIDFSHEALAAARGIVGEHVNRIRYGDFFAPIAEAPFEVVYERAFLCALPRRRWAEWGRRMAELVETGGVLAGFFYFDAGDRGPPRVPLHGGPPFPLNAPYELAELLEPAFERVDDAPVPDSIEVFKGKERWQVWHRR